MNQSLDRIARDTCDVLEEELQRSGIFYRIFSRAKSEDSIKKKLAFKNYDTINTGKMVQDLIGIRITLYFTDDLPIIHKLLKAKSNFVNETVDKDEETVFKPSRVNLIFRLDESKSEEVTDTVISKFKYVDTTYEVQLRTVLSEGWHEVDHDLRYKCDHEWDENADLGRTFNGVYASLVTSDWSILKIFELLSYRHYKAKNWSAMLRNGIRLRFRQEPLAEELRIILDENPDLAKRLFRMDRSEFLNYFILNQVRIPLTFSNIVFVVNAYYLKNEEIKKITPEFILSNKLLF